MCNLLVILASEVALVQTNNVLTLPSNLVLNEFVHSICITIFVIMLEGLKLFCCSILVCVRENENEARFQQHFIST